MGEMGVNSVPGGFSKRREYWPDLAIYLWYSFGTASVLLQEIITIYPYILPPTLTASQSNRGEHNFNSPLNVRSQSTGQLRPFQSATPWR